MKKKEPVNLYAVRKFYDPINNRGPYASILSDAIKLVVQELNGKNLSLRDALKKLKSVTDDETLRVVITKEINFIMLEIKRPDQKCAVRLISFA